MPQSSPAPAALPPLHLLLALVIVAIWGTNFVVIHEGLEEFPPFTFAALRFLFASLPLLPFFAWPAASLRTVASYGLLVGVGQFGLMLYAMDGHITPGLASTIIQTQAFFTVALAVLANGERLGRSSLAGLAICGVGIAVIAGHTGGEVSLLGIALSLVAAMAWAIANIVAKRAGPINALALVAWSNLFAIGPLFAAALLFEGPDQVFGSISAASLGGWGTVLWQAFGNAVFGYGAWNWLLGRHAASRIAPLGLMVPVFGLGASAWYLAEPLPGWKLLAAALIVSGLALNLLPKRA